LSEFYIERKDPVQKAERALKKKNFDLSQAQESDSREPLGRAKKRKLRLEKYRPQFYMKFTPAIRAGVRLLCPPVLLVMRSVG